MRYYTFVTILLLSSCGSKKEVVERFDDGEPKKVIEHTGRDSYCERSYYDRGGVREEKFFVHGLQEGMQTYFREDGSRGAEAMFVKGVRQGITHEFHKNGRIAFEGICVNGRFEGISTTFYPNGQLKDIGNRHLDRDTGFWRTFDSTGTPKAEYHYPDTIDLQSGSIIYQR